MKAYQRNNQIYNNSWLPLVNRDLQHTSFTLKGDHIARKNPSLTQKPVMFATTDLCQAFTSDLVFSSILSTLDPRVQVTPL